MRRPRLFAVFVVVAAAATPLIPRPARACGACTEYRPHAASQRTEALPANARILVGGDAVEAADVAVSLVDDGSAVDAVVERVDDDHVFVVPSAPAGARIRVSLRGVAVADYTIGGDVDDAAPTIAGLATDGAGGMCCDDPAVQLVPVDARDDDGTEPQALRLAVSSPAGDREVLLSLGVGFEPMLGGGACVGTDALAAVGDAVDVAARAIDWAGNESDVVTTGFVYERATRGGCPGAPPSSLPPSCATTTGEPAALLLVAVVAAAVSARPRRPRPSWAGRRASTS